MSAVFRHVRSTQKEQINNHNGLLLKMRCMYQLASCPGARPALVNWLHVHSPKFNIGILVHELFRCWRRRQCIRRLVLFLQSLPINVACFSRLRLAMPLMIDLHNFCSFLSLLSSPIHHACCAPVVCDHSRSFNVNVFHLIITRQRFHACIFPFTCAHDP